MISTMSGVVHNVVTSSYLLMTLTVTYAGPVDDSGLDIDPFTNGKPGMPGIRGTVSQHQVWLKPKHTSTSSGAEFRGGMGASATSRQQLPRSVRGVNAPEGRGMDGWMSSTENWACVMTRV